MTTTRVRASFSASFFFRSWPFLLVLFGQVLLQQVLCAAAASEEAAVINEGGEVEASDAVGKEESDAFEEHGEVEPFVAILFPAFSLVIGVIVFYILSR